jgi:hypothetical protein
LRVILRVTLGVPGRCWGRANNHTDRRPTRAGAGTSVGVTERPVGTLRSEVQEGLRLLYRPQRREAHTTGSSQCSCGTDGGVRTRRAGAGHLLRSRGEKTNEISLPPPRPTPRVAECCAARVRTLPSGSRPAFAGPTVLLRLHSDAPTHPKPGWDGTLPKPDHRIKRRGRPWTHALAKSHRRTASSDIRPGLMLHRRGGQVRGQGRVVR